MPACWLHPCPYLIPPQVSLFLQYLLQVSLSAPYSLYVSLFLCSYLFLSLDVSLRYPFLGVWSCSYPRAMVSVRTGRLRLSPFILRPSGGSLFLSSCRYASTLCPSTSILTLLLVLGPILYLGCHFVLYFINFQFQVFLLHSKKNLLLFFSVFIMPVGQRPWNLCLYMYVYVYLGTCKFSSMHVYVRVYHYGCAVYVCLPNGTVHVCLSWRMCVYLYVCALNLRVKINIVIVTQISWEKIIPTSNSHTKQCWSHFVLAHTWKRKVRWVTSNMLIRCTDVLTSIHRPNIFLRTECNIIRKKWIYLYFVQSVHNYVADIHLLIVVDRTNNYCLEYNPFIIQILIRLIPFLVLPGKESHIRHTVSSKREICKMRKWKTDF